MGVCWRVCNKRRNISAAIREAKEEVGIALSPEDGKLMHSVTGRVVNGIKFSDILDVWLFRYDGDIDLKQATTYEVIQTFWMNKSQIKELFDKGKLVPTLKYFFKIIK